MSEDSDDSSGFTPQQQRILGRLDRFYKSPKAQPREATKTGSKPQRINESPEYADNPLESTEQKKVASYLDRLEVFWCHVANERKTSVIQGARLKAQGVKSGVPDVLIYQLNPISRQPVAIELKRKKGGRLTENQKLWLAKLKSNGWITYVARGADDAIEFLIKWGYTK